MNLKLKHYIATHTFHSSDALKGFKSAFKHRKKNSDWFNNETVDAKKHFFRTLSDRKIVDENSWDEFDSSNYAVLYQLFWCLHRIVSPCVLLLHYFSCFTFVLYFTL